MLKKMLKSVLPIALVIAMLFSQSALAATSAYIYALNENGDVINTEEITQVTKDQEFAVVVAGAAEGEMVTILVYEDADTDGVFDDSENILYIWQTDATSAGATFKFTLRDNVIVDANDVKAVAIGTQNNPGDGYAASKTFAVVPDVVYHTVTWKNYDGTVLATNDQVAEGETATYTGETPTKAADAQYTYTFDKWSDPVTDENGNVTYTATFTETANTYTVSWKVDGVEVHNEEVAYGAAITEYAYEVAEGYDFSGWSTIPETMPAEDIEIVGTTAIKTFVVTYMNGEEVVYEETVNYGADVQNVPAVPAKEGYTGTWSADGKAIKATTTINAEYAINSYTLAFTINGEAYGEVQTVEYGAAIVAPEYTVAEGYTFSGWTVPETMPAENITLDATLTKNSYTVTWNVDGEEYATTTVVYGEAIVAPEYEVAEGYTFSGWGEVAATMPAQNLTYNATTSIITFVVTYMNGEEVVYEETVNYGADVQNVPAVPAKEGYTGTWNADGKAIKATTTINAEYAINSYTLAFTINGEAYGEAQTVEYGVAIVAPEYTAAEGYTFSGWTVPETMPAQDLTINATLTINEYTVTWIVDGVETTETYTYGATPAFKGSTDKAADDQYTYEFKGWTPEIATVTGGATYTAVFEAVAKTQYFIATFGDDADEIKVAQDAEDKTITLPAANGSKEFAGWKAGETFLPAGAEYELTADVDFAAVYVDLAMVDGAAIRLDKANPGLRFTTNGTKIDGAEYGTLLALDAALQSRGLQDTYTIEDIQSFNGNLPEGKTALKCANVKANYFYDEEPMDYRTVMVIEQIDANTGMYDYAWAARSYVTVKYSNDTTATFYSNVVKRSPKAVAESALAEGTYEGDALDVLNVYAGK